MHDQLFVLAAITQSTYCFVWDVLMDWGLPYRARRDDEGLCGLRMRTPLVVSRSKALYLSLCAFNFGATRPPARRHRPTPTASRPYNRAAPPTSHLPPTSRLPPTTSPTSHLPPPASRLPPPSTTRLTSAGLRFIWALSIFGSVPGRSWGMFFLEVVEMARRTVWAVFRVEWEMVHKIYQKDPVTHATRATRAPRCHAPPRAPRTSPLPPLPATFALVRHSHPAFFLGVCGVRSRACLFPPPRTTRRVRRWACYKRKVTEVCSQGGARCTSGGFPALFCRGCIVLLFHCY